MLVFSDLHLRAESAAVCKQVLWGVLDEARALGEEVVAFLGDFYHIRYQVPVVLQNMVRDWLDDCASARVSVVLLPGNHDQVDERGQNALSVFHSPPGVVVHSDPSVDDHGCWMPYRKADAVPGCLDFLRDRAGLYQPLFAHLPVRGAMMNNLVVDDRGVGLDRFRGFRCTLLGHYHKQQDLAGGALRYVGSPWQTRGDEWGQPKGFATWDGRSLVRHDRVWGRRYHRVNAESSASPPVGPLIGEGPDDHVRVRLASVTQDWRDWAAAQSAIVVLEDASASEVQTRFAFREGCDLSEYAAKYVHDCAGQLDPNVLWSMWDDIRSKSG